MQRPHRNRCALPLLSLRLHVTPPPRFVHAVRGLKQGISQIRNPPRMGGGELFFRCVPLAVSRKSFFDFLRLIFWRLRMA